MYQFTEDDIIWLKAHGFTIVDKVNNIYEIHHMWLIIRVTPCEHGFYCRIIRFLLTEDFIGHGKTMKDAMNDALRLVQQQMEVENASLEKAKQIIGALK